MANAAQSNKTDTGSYLLLTGMVEREDDQYVSICPELGVASCGDTVEEAFEMLADAIEVHLLGLVEIGTLNEELRERNVRIEYDTLPYEYRPRVPVRETNGVNGPMYQFFRTQLPV